MFRLRRGLHNLAHFSILKKKNLKTAAPKAILNFEKLFFFTFLRIPIISILIKIRIKSWVRGSSHVKQNKTKRIMLNKEVSNKEGKKHSKISKTVAGKNWSVFTVGKSVWTVTLAKSAEPLVLLVSAPQTEHCPQPWRHIVFSRQWQGCRINRAGGSSRTTQTHTSHFTEQTASSWGLPRCPSGVWFLHKLSSSFSRESGTAPAESPLWIPKPSVPLA